MFQATKPKVYGEALGYFLAVFEATKLSICDKTSGHFQVLIVVTEPDRKPPCLNALMYCEELSYCQNHTKLSLLIVKKN